MTQLQRVGLGAMLYALYFTLHFEPDASDMLYLPTWVVTLKTAFWLSAPIVIWVGLILFVSGKDKKHGPE